MPTTPLIEQFSQAPWLENIGQPHASAQVMGDFDEDDADSFFEPPYTDPYEALCVADHQAADQVRKTLRSKKPAQIAKKAYLAAWAHFPHPEVCGLISDDAETIMTLLQAQAPLSAFTLERIRWYQQGRAPWGYLGDYPGGQWLIL